MASLDERRHRSSFGSPENVRGDFPALWNSELFIMDLAMKLRWRTSLIIFDSCQRFDATFPQSSNLLRHTSAISYVVTMH
jgi:hypothetical protein